MPALLLAALLIPQRVTVRNDLQTEVVANGLVTVRVDLRTGSFDVRWGDRAWVKNVSGEVRLTSGAVLSTASKPQGKVRLEVRKVQDSFGTGVRVVIRHLSTVGPELRHTVWLYANRPELLVRLEAVGDGKISTNSMSPIASAAVQFAQAQPGQSLYVPYDNDSYVRYRSDGWVKPNDDEDGSHEVGAVYDDTSRNGLIVGSLDHEQWKSGIRLSRGVSSVGLEADAGVASKDTRDTEPHGAITGRVVRSPRFCVGYYGDWRQGLERYGDLNALVKPLLPWAGPPPVGWSSWSGHKTKLRYKDGEAAISFVQSELPWFRSAGTAFMNLDSFWDNLTRSQIRQFVVKAHAAGLKAGIYWTPFVAWGGLDAKVPGTPYDYGDLALKGSDGKPLQKLDGGRPLDPTHPGTLARIDSQLADFADLGFDLIKLDFLTHGALEGRHANRKITTGNEAYSLGMQRILDDLSPAKVHRPIFICLSICPMFPSGYGHSRRISCDVFANIGATEYFLNSANYAWWEEGRLYQFNDPDSACVYEPLGEPSVTEAESRSRITASAIGGGMAIEGDDLTNPKAKDRVRLIYGNRELLELARTAPAFRPVSGDTGDKAGDAFAWVQPGGKSAYLACFNFDKTRHKSISVELSRLGLPSRKKWKVHDLWTKTDRNIGGVIHLDLAPTDCALVHLNAR